MLAICLPAEPITSHLKQRMVILLLGQATISSSLQFVGLSAEMERKMYNLSKNLDVEEVTNMLLDDADPTLNEDLGEESEIDSHDEVEVCEVDSETEQDGDSDEDEDVESYYMGKDKKTQWNKKPLQKKCREPQNIITHLPAVIGTASNAKTAVECWNSLLTDDILDSIVTYTNQYIDVIKDKFICNRTLKATDEIELRAFFGLLYLAGAYRANRQSLEELWSKDRDGVEKFGLVMSINRFKLLIRCLRFDDRTTRTERKTHVRLATIRDIFQKFVENCKKSYCPGENLTIDEMLPGFRGKCAFGQYIPSKPNKYGIKMYALVDASKTYTYNLEVYAGKQPEGPYCVSNKPSDVVKRLAEPLFGSGRNITADNWFSNCDLIDYLKMQKLSYVGTVRKNKKELPTQFVSVKGRQQYSSMFAFHNGKVLVSYVPQAKKIVLLLSTLHDDDAIDPGTEAQKNPGDNYIL
ncbi:succinyl-CoA:glutarate CoA-transferase isoform X2 [Phyllobates terribilis]|uniref:succinyl-CoA:glutarate CoA-transferase isoform X2 n=1 Tax=Phyllobates terribilis TaxID=111132 RepID=UPI003CCAD14B